MLLWRARLLHPGRDLTSCQSGPQQVASGQSGAAPGQQLVELKDAAGEEIDFRAQDGQFPLAAGDQIRLTYVQQTPFGAEQAQNVATAITVTQVSTPTQN